MSYRGLILGALALLPACAPRVTPPDRSWYETGPQSSPLTDYSAAFVLSWQGARIGSAVEELQPDSTADATGYVFHRREEIVIRRDGEPVSYSTTIAISTDSDLTARTVAVRRRTGATTLVGSATRRDDGDWWVSFGGEPGRVVPGDAVPVELVPLLVASRSERRFQGKVLMAGYGFSVAELEVTPDDDQRPARRVVAVVTTALGQLQSEIELAEDGTLSRVSGGDTVSATRVDPAELRADFDPPELVASSAIAVTGPPPRGPIALELVLDRPAPPPALPGQRVSVHDGRWDVVLLPGDQGDTLIPLAESEPVDPEMSSVAAAVVRAAGAHGQRAEVVALARATARLLEDDLSAPGLEAGTALALGRGDCTAHAALFAALARARGIATRLVTGYRLDGRRLVRHRWAVAAVDGAWIAVDPANGEAPAHADLLGLAIHGGSAAELAVVDEMTFSGMSGARARFIDRRSSRSTSRTH